MTWDLAITNRAARDLRRPSPADRARVDEAFSAMRAEPLAGDTKLLRAMDGAYRRRVGDWRIFFDLHQKKRLIVVTAVKRRGSKTY